MTHGLPWWCNAKESACQCETQVRSLSQEDPLPGPSILLEAALLQDCYLTSVCM